MLRRSAILALCIAFASAAHAQEGNRFPVISNPLWITRPPVATAPERFPTSDYRMRVDLTCRVEGGVLRACEAVEETPEAFLVAARNAAETARIEPLDGGGRPTEGREINVSIGFPMLVSTDPHPSTPNPNVIRSPVWLSQPSEADRARNFPEAAIAAGVASGRVLIECLVGGDGRLSCNVVSETPSGVGFGAAALRVASGFRMADRDAAGEPTAGKRWRGAIPFSRE